MKNTQILTQFDNAEMIGVKIIIAVFMAIFLLLSFILGLTLTVFIASFMIARKALLYILNHREARILFAVIGA